MSTGAGTVTMPEAGPQPDFHPRQSDVAPRPEPESDRTSHSETVPSHGPPLRGGAPLLRSEISTTPEVAAASGPFRGEADPIHEVCSIEQLCEALFDGLRGVADG